MWSAGGDRNTVQAKRMGRVAFKIDENMLLALCGSGELHGPAQGASAAAPMTIRDHFHSILLEAKRRFNEVAVATA